MKTKTKQIMVFSMTGFGKAEANLTQKQITIEIKSLNGKTADVSLRMPSLYRPLEHKMRTLAIEKLKRGKIDIYINEEYIDGLTDAEINTGVMEQYLHQLLPFMQDNNLSPDASLVRTLLSLPQSLQTKKTDFSEAEQPELLRAFEEAIDKVVDFRQKEGAVLAADLLNYKTHIAELLKQVPKYEQRRIDRVKKRLLDALEKLQTEYDANRFEQELIYYLEKLDISEEKIRLETHLNYFEETLTGDSREKGKKLGFIAQEMGREINTLGSKANDSDLQHLVVEMKDVLEKIKEQLANVL